VVTVSSQFPDRQTLLRGLTSVFSGNGYGRGRPTFLRREQSLHATSFPCEIVRCQFEDGNKLALFCKYESGDGSCSHGQRGGVAYEIQVYRQVLQPSQVSAPTFYGSYADRRADSTWLVLEYLKRSTAVGKLSTRVMRAAASWIGRFHAIHEARLATSPVRFLTTYDAKYYRGWGRRTVQFAGRWRREFPWLDVLCGRWEEDFASLAARQPTIIHGEYYPHNILFQRGVIRPVDWETAAIAVGEIDLATLIEGWPRKITRLLEVEYRRARWPNGSPADFERTVDLARVYVQLRWLGDKLEFTNERGSRERFQMLRRAGKRSGLI
jgi:thiamine kinase-like enzyme